MSDYFVLVAAQQINEEFGLGLSTYPFTRLVQFSHYRGCQYAYINLLM